jgi:hypothetical protein
VTVEISSNPITANISINESKEFDLDGDGKNDLSVELKEIKGQEAVIHILYIGKSAITINKGESVNQTNQTADNGAPIAARISGAIIALAFIALVALIAHWVSTRRQRKQGK